MIWNSWYEPLSNYTEKSILQEVLHIFKKYGSIPEVNFHSIKISEAIILIENTCQFIGTLNIKDKLLISRLMLMTISFKLL